MSFLKKANNAKSVINQAGGINSSITSVTVDDASDFPVSGDFLVTIWDRETYPDPSDDPSSEIVKVTSVIGNIFTIVRGQEDTIGAVHADNSSVQMLITAGTFEELETQINALNPGQNVYNDELSSQVDGVATEFTTSDDYIGGTLQVYLGGLRQIPGVSADYVETGVNTFEFNVAPSIGAKIVVDYIKS